MNLLPFTTRSTSLLNINADTGLTKWQMRAYKLSNLINNSFPNLFIDPKLIIKDFSLANPNKYWPLIEKISSPSRALSNLFWLSLPWSQISKELGSINTFDIGCGSGNYGLFLTDKAKANFTSYTGLDIKPHPNWETIKANHPHFNFLAGNSNNISIPSTTNLIISQSAIEHFSADLTFFQKIKNFINSTPEPVIQIHLFPSSACLKLYRFHGFRQYTPRTISKITRLFPNSNTLLYKLGSSHCNDLHWQTITNPKIKGLADQRQDNSSYFSNLTQAITKDFTSPDNHPSFYALVIHSHSQHKIFS